ncbi:MAG: glycosyltransferase family 2 protein [Anaerolineales bacterium]|nr:glycosyltransferase family 2 protein [Anaerolineales bacterium]MCB8987619.1 glycosyltransferase family 2 protein [Ardenticatenaceae bacterium]
MVLLLSILQIILLLAGLLLAVLVGYLLLLTLVAWWVSKRFQPESGPANRRFVILVPAHNEERLLPDLLRNLGQLGYSKELFTIHVVADNCTDQTAVVGRQNGAVVHERFDAAQPGKGYALQWLLQRLWASGEPHDAVVILDADTVVSANFLQAMSVRLARGERVIQAYYAVRDPGRSWSVGLRYAALAVLHYLRPLGRTALGGSAGLKGNGMVFAADVMRQNEWSASITEDIEFHMRLILNGERVTFAPEAVIEAEMPETLAGAASQNVRWERGRMQMLRLYVPQLLRAAGRSVRQGRYRRAYLFIDAAMEHIIPPFSVLAALSGLFFLLAALALGLTGLLGGGPTAVVLAQINFWLAVGVILGQAVYLLSGLRMVHAPRSVYRALVNIPVFVTWKIWHYGRVLFGLDSHAWVRTARNDEV